MEAHVAERKRSKAQNAFNTVGAVQALADVQRQGCNLLTSLAGAALSGDSAAATALCEAGAALAIVHAIETYSESVEHLEGGIAALCQLAVVDLPSVMSAGAAEAIARSMQLELA
eukprot:4692518-Prymnesium_polylepis.1